MNMPNAQTKRAGIEIYVGELTAKVKRGDPQRVYRAAATTREAVQSSLARGIRRDCETSGESPDVLLRQLHQGAWDLRIFEEGVAYRGAWPIGIEEEDRSLYGAAPKAGR